MGTMILTKENLIDKTFNLINNLINISIKHNSVEILKNLNENLPVDLLGYQIIVRIYNNLITDKDDEFEEKDVRLISILDYKQNIFTIQLEYTHSKVKPNEKSSFKIFNFKHDFNLNVQVESIEEKGTIENDFNQYDKIFYKYVSIFQSNLRIINDIV